MDPELRPRAMTASERKWYETVRLSAVWNYPFLNHGFFALKPVIIPGFDTWAVDAKARLFIGEETIQKWTIGEQVGALIHELNHILRNHMDRYDTALGGGQSNNKLWNIAADMEINDDIVEFFSKKHSGKGQLSDTDATLPGSPWLPSLVGYPDGETAEQYAKRLMDGQDNGSGDGDQDGGSGEGPSGDGSGDGKPSSIEDMAAQSSCSADHAGTSKASLSADADGFQGLSEPEVASMVEQMAKDIVNHDQSKGRGSVPAGMLIAAQAALLPPAVDWRRELSSAFRGAIFAASSKMDYTYRRINRRAANDEIAPGMHAPVPTVRFYIDTSGSMGQETDIIWAISEVEGISKRRGIRGRNLSILTVDAEVNSKARPYNGPKSLQLRGGGGTDMRECFTDILAIKPALRPSVMIIGTDGGTPWPSDPVPGVKTIVLLTRDTFKSNVPSWAKVIVIDRSE